MIRDDPYLAASLAAEKVVKEHDIATLPVDPIALASALDIEVRAKPAHSQGVSGMFLHVNNKYGIAYTTHIANIGFQNFSVAHELGHYFLPGHTDAVLADGDVHESRAGFTSGDRYEMEADHFAASLLMPRLLFMEAMRTSGEGIAAIEKLANLCRTSLTATGIRYVQCSRDPLAIVLSTGNQINYCFMSDGLREIKDLNWIRKGTILPRNTTTFAFNQDVERVGQAARTSGTSDLQDWFSGDRSIPITEEVAGLGSYGKTLTVLTALDLEERLEEIEEEENLIESWTPKFRL